MADKLMPGSEKVKQIGKYDIYRFPNPVQPYPKNGNIGHQRTQYSYSVMHRADSRLVMTSNPKKGDAVKFVEEYFDHGKKDWWEMSAEETSEVGNEPKSPPDTKLGGFKVGDKCVYLAVTGDYWFGTVISINVKGREVTASVKSPKTDKVYEKTEGPDCFLTLLELKKKLLDQKKVIEASLERLEQFGREPLSEEYLLV